VRVGAICAVSAAMHRKPPPRLKAFDYTGWHRYLLTICTRQRNPVFHQTTFAVQPTEQLRECAEQCSFAVVVYCFMPDHVHALATAKRGDADFREFVRIWKQRTAFHAKRRLGLKLWQRSFDDRVLRNDESTEFVAWYILMNPVRKRLVRSPEEYPYLGSFVTTVRDLMERAQELESAGPT
jgi:putative transposase